MGRVLLKRFLLLIFVSTTVLGADSNHINIHLKNRGIQKVLIEVLNHYKDKQNKSVFVIPGASVNGKIEKDSILENPIINKLIQNYISFDLTKDLSFHVKWSPIKVEAEIDEDSFQIQTLGKDKTIHVNTKFDFKGLSISGDFIEICESVDSNGNCKCEELDEKNQCLRRDGLYGKFEKYNLDLVGDKPLSALVKLKTNLDQDSMSLDFLGLKTNIFSSGTKSDQLDNIRFGINTDAPKFDLNFSKFTMPPPILKVNGKSFVVQVDYIQRLMLDESEFLAKQLTFAAGKFITQDLVRILNEKLIKNLGHISSQFEIVNYDKHRKEREEFIRLSKVDPKAAVEYLMSNKKDQISEGNISEKVEQIFASTVRSLQNKLLLNQINSFSNRDVNLAFNNELVINQKKIKIGDKVWNGKKTLQELDFNSIESYQEFEAAVGISEPFINSIINSNINLFLANKLFQTLAPKAGVYIRGINLHFMAQNRKSCELNRIKAVLKLGIRLNELEKEGFSDYVSHLLGDFIEGEIVLNPYTLIPELKSNELIFPLEFDLQYSFQDFNDETTLRFQVDPSFTNSNFDTTYNYPIQDISQVVRNGVYEQIQENLVILEGQVFTVDVSKFMKKIPGFDLKLRDVYVVEQGHVVFGLDIDEIDISKLRGDINEE